MRALFGRVEQNGVARDPSTKGWYRYADRGSDQVLEVHMSDTVETRKAAARTVSSMVGGRKLDGEPGGRIS